MPNPVVALEILDWGVSLGGEHFTARLMGYNGRTYHVVELEHALTQGEAERLNLKDRNMLSRYKAGDMTQRFETEEDCARVARNVWECEFPRAKVLIRGSLGRADPQACLEGPDWFKDECNRLWRRFEDYSGYEGNEAGCTELYHQYQALLERLEL